MKSSAPIAQRPRLALAIGDAAGIGPELAARLLVDRQITGVADLIVIGDQRVLEKGAQVAKVAPDFDRLTLDDTVPDEISRPILLDLGHLDPATICVGELSRESGGSALENFKMALALARVGDVGAVTFTPFNKAAMRLADPAYEDEISFATRILGLTETVSEFNILPSLWNARVTSHVPLAEVAPLISTERILEGLRLTDRAMREAGISSPRIAVAALNPHAGDGGNFGQEEIQVIEPAVRQAKAGGIICDGPFPSDTVFVRARRGDFDAVLTMYHDQGQIAMKLIGFEEGVTLLGGMPFPVLTPAHGSAYDIAGQGIANPGASRQALLLAARVAKPHGPHADVTFRHRREALQN